MNKKTSKNAIFKLVSNVFWPFQVGLAKNNAFFLFGLSVGWNKNERFFAKIFGGNKKRLYLCTRKQRERVLKKKMVR